jgi:TonB family protein
MKTNKINNIAVLFFALLFIQHTYAKELSIRKEKLNEAQFITDLVPELWSSMALPNKERMELDYRRKMGYGLGYYIYPDGGYDLIVDYIGIEISAVCNDKVVTSESSTGELTLTQKNILNAVKFGDRVNIKVKFKYKSKGKMKQDQEIIEGYLGVTVMPEVEAEFPGGFKQITAYLMENVFSKMSDANAYKKLQRVIVKFTVNEQGEIVNVKLLYTSNEPKLDKLIVDAIYQMPKWIPAKDSKGKNVKQEFTIPFGREGC